ncbi:hypothetical protein [Aquitalea sp.]|uniref:hypothetical protein n=1 Tax=Aquitalea sp. TaxID=1872623 RepID=UPI0025853162|nr:hypothetical protein [Aquitalea sp.]
MNSRPATFQDAQQIRFAYLLAVTAGALVFALCQTITWFWLWVRSGSDIGNVLMMGAVFFAFVWLCAALLAVLPYRLCIWLSEKFALYHWAFYVSGAVVTSLGLMLLYHCIASSPGVQMDGVKLLSTSAVLPRFLLSGTAAGLVCWAYLRK